MSIPLAQNFFKETVTTAWTTGAGNFYISTKPTNSIGYLVLNPSSAGSREIIKFTAVGTDGGGDYVTVTAANRGLGGTTELAHAIGESVYMNVTAEHIQDMSDALDQIVSANAQYATESVIGIVKMNSAPSESLGTVTMTIATPAVFTFNTHGLAANDIVKFTTDGALPTGIVANTRYYVIATGLTTNTFQVSATLDGTAVDTSGTQSGTHTLLDVTPKAIGPNDPALPTLDQKDALAGNIGTPSDTNKYITEEGLVDIQEFTTSGTWTKPTGLKRILVQIWGGGGGGVSGLGVANAGGGGGGGYAEKWIEAADLGATETVTIGAGGAAGRPASNGVDSTFGSLLTAFGGGGGDDSATTTHVTGGGGAGPFSAGTVGAATTADNSGDISFPISGNGKGESALYGGGGGNYDTDGGKSVHAGAGGGGAKSGVNHLGGTSVSGGDGGDAGTTAQDGSVPAGGGGASFSGGTGGDGGDGKCIIKGYFI